MHHRLQRRLRLADRAHAVVDAPRPQPPLRDLEAAPLAEQHVGGGHAHVVQDDLGVVVLVAEERERAQDVEARLFKQ